MGEKLVVKRVVAKMVIVVCSSHNNSVERRTIEMISIKNPIGSYFKNTHLEVNKMMHIFFSGDFQED